MVNKRKIATEIAFRLALLLECADYQGLRRYCMGIFEINSPLNFFPSPQASGALIMSGGFSTLRVRKNELIATNILRAGPCLLSIVVE